MVRNFTKTILGKTPVDLPQANGILTTFVKWANVAVAAHVSIDQEAQILKHKFPNKASTATNML